MNKVTKINGMNYITRNQHCDIQLNGKKYCYFCKNYHESLFCGYISCECKIYGSLDVDQNERHPDKTANTCINYNEINNIEDNELYQSIKNQEA